MFLKNKEETSIGIFHNKIIAGIKHSGCESWSETADKNIIIMYHITQTSLEETSSSKGVNLVIARGHRLSESHDLLQTDRLFFILSLITKLIR